LAKGNRYVGEFQAGLMHGAAGRTGGIVCRAAGAVTLWHGAGDNHHLHLQWNEEWFE